MSKHLKDSNKWLRFTEKDSILELIGENVRPEKTVETATENDAAFAPFTKLDLRLITDLQSCIKVQKQKEQET